MDPEANPGIKYCIISILYINDSPCKYASKATKAHNIIDINADNWLLTNAQCYILDL